jgi:hypothetical protein
MQIEVANLDIAVAARPWQNSFPENRAGTGLFPQASNFLPHSHAPGQVEGRTSRQRIRGCVVLKASAMRSSGARHTGQEQISTAILGFWIGDQSHLAGKDCSNSSG